MAREDVLLSLGDAATRLLSEGTTVLKSRYGDAPVFVLRVEGAEQPGLIHTRTGIPLSGLRDEDSKEQTGSIDREQLNKAAAVAEDTRKFERSSPWARMAQPDSVIVPVRKTDRNPFLGFISIGRARNNDICLNSPSVSKLHATISSADGSWKIEDKSSNGTWVEKERLKRGKPHPLLPGHQVAFAEVNGMFLDLDGLEALCHAVPH